MSLIKLNATRGLLGALPAVSGASLTNVAKLETAMVTASGQSNIDFTSIPSGVTIIFVTLENVYKGSSNTNTVTITATSASTSARTYTRASTNLVLVPVPILVQQLLLV